MILIAIANMIRNTVPHRIPYAIPNLMLHMLLNAIRHMNLSLITRRILNRTLADTEEDLTFDL